MRLQNISVTMKTEQLVRISLTYLLYIQFGYCEIFPPHIYEQATESEIIFSSYPDEPVRLPCIATGNPKPRYEWKHNGAAYYPGDSDVEQATAEGTLIFSSVTLWDEGFYQCFASNKYGVSVSKVVHLRKSMIDVMGSQNTTTHYVDVGSHYTLPCVSPVSYPPATIIWQTTDENNKGITDVKLDKRVTMDLEGRLRFTNTKLSDHQYGKAYKCAAYNHVLAIMVSGPKHVIHVLNVNAQQHAPSVMWTSPTDSMFLKGSILELKCIFAGNPTPDVEWKKRDGTLPATRSMSVSSGQQLEIYNVQMSDAGQYECIGNNSLSTTSRGFYVRIESVPEWTTKPQSVKAYVGDKVTFVCEAAAQPDPVYTWYINGEPLDDSVRDHWIYKNSRFSKTDRNRITLSDVIIDDMMNIQCNASNKHGYVFADVYLNVTYGEKNLWYEPTTNSTMDIGPSDVTMGPSQGTTNRPPIGDTTTGGGPVGGTETVLHHVMCLVVTLAVYIQLVI